MHRPTLSTKIFNAVTLGALLAMNGLSPAIAQVSSGTTGIDASGNTQTEITACNTGRTQQDRETCLKEARNASADKKAGKLEGSSTQLGTNASQRCEAFLGEEKIACEARVAGFGNTSGSVGGGGVIRQVETVVIPSDGTTVRVQPQSNSDNLIVIPAPQ